jgi:O-antigen biosynthesis protein
MTDIIIPFYNKSELTIQCLKSVMQASALHCRIVLVDDGSDKPESDKVARFIGGTTWPHLFLRKNINEGFKEAMRAGIRECHDQFIILLNNDTLLTTGFDEKLIRALRTNPSVKASAPVSNHPTDLFQFRENLHAVRFDGFCTPAGVDAVFRQHAPAITDVLTIAPYITGMCLALDREVLLQVGVFDPFYKNGYFEDLDLCCRIRQQGYQVAIVEDCFVFHQGHATYRQKTREEKEDIIFHNFKVFGEKWGHISEHQDLLQKMEFAGKEDPI